MKIKFTIIAFFIGTVFANAQSSIFSKPASLLPVDSLKRALPLLRDTARADCLHGISWWYSSPPNFFNRDSALKYIDLEYKESIRLGYNKGIGGALSNMAIMEMISNHFPVSERYFRDCIPYYEKAQHNGGIAWSHRNLGITLYSQGRFDEAIEEFKTSIPFYQRYHNKNSNEGMSSALQLLSKTYGLKGELETGFEIAEKCLAENQQRNDSFGIAFPLMIIGDLYQSMEDYSTALEYYYLSASLGGFADVNLYLQMSAAHNAMHRYDSALYYYQVAKSIYPTRRNVRTVLGEIYMYQKKYNEALAVFKKEVVFFKYNNIRVELLRVLPDIARVYAAQKNYREALYYAQEGLTLAQTTGSRQYKAAGLQLLAAIYETMGVSTKSFFYLKQYIALRDSLLNDQLKAKIFAYRSKAENEKKQSRIRLLEKEKQINQQQLKIQQQQLQKEALMKKILAGGLVSITLLSIIILRNIVLKRRNEKHLRELAENELQIQKLESERTKAELQQQTVQLQMQALRAQMNPHFIFNSLNSINRFILKKQSREAAEYLTKFARLIRMILHSSASETVNLADELAALELYMELESLRFEQKFIYKIQCDPEVDATFIQIPPMLLQPYVENAIWHGLMLKKGEGHLWVNISREDSALTCTITDDGIGRKKSAEIKSRSAYTARSMGMRITAERIALLQQQKKLNAFIHITDLVLSDGTAGGTEVLIKIPAVYD